MKLRNRNVPSAQVSTLQGRSKVEKTMKTKKAANAKKVASALNTRKLREKKWFPLTSFPMFEKFPLELRQEIWSMSLVARTVEVEAGPRKFFTQTPLPAVLSACPDSRAAVIDLYPISFSSKSMVSKIRFNFFHDTLSLTRMGLDSMQAQTIQVLQFFDTFTREEKDSIQQIAMTAANYKIVWKHLEGHFNGFTALKKLLVINDIGRTHSGVVASFRDSQEVARIRSARTLEPSGHKQWEFFKDFPAELIENAMQDEQLNEEDGTRIVQPIDESYRPRDSYLDDLEVEGDLIPEWIWGWRRTNYPAFY